MLLESSKRTIINPDTIMKAVVQSQKVELSGPTIEVPDDHVLVVTATYGVTGITEDGTALNINPPDGTNEYPWLIFYGYAKPHNPSKIVTAAVFAGAGLDDLTSGGSDIQNTPRDQQYYVEVDSVGGTDTFRWSKDGGVSFEAEGIAMTGATQTLENGVTVTFGATTGHTLNDSWTFTAKAEGTPRQVTFAAGTVVHTLVKGS